MTSGDGAGDQQQRILRLAAGWDPQSVSLSPVEGFLLSRIDGRTSWATLRQIGGIAPEDVDRTLEGWLAQGYLCLDGGALAAEAAARTPAGEKPEDDDDLDPALDLPPELQKRILVAEAGLDGSYHEILGIERGADAKAVKRAYFALSKVFHPDRYYRREIGEFAPRLERIFKKVVEAYELLSDPTTRSEIERTMEDLAPAAGAYRGGAGERESIGPERPKRGYRKPSRLENLERLRRRFQMPKKVLAERRFKASKFFESAKVAAHRQLWLEAAASARLAIAFDPWNREFKEGFAEIQGHVHRVRADALLARAGDADVKAEALRLLEEALAYRPMDAQANARAAQLALETQELEKAREYAEAACELEPGVAAHLARLSRVLRRQGHATDASEALERGAALDPRDPEVLSEQKQLGRRGRRR